MYQRQQPSCLGSEQSLNDARRCPAGLGRAPVKCEDLTNTKLGPACFLVCNDHPASIGKQ